MTPSTTSIVDLYALQETDSALDERRATIERAEARIADTIEVDEARAEFEARDADRLHAELAQRAIELDLEELREKIEPLEKKLYGGTVRSPKELADLELEDEALKRHRSGIEDQALEAMAATEEAQAAAQEARKRLEEVEEARAAENLQLEAERRQALTEIEALEARRGRQTGLIDPATLRLYEALRSGRQGRAVVRVERGLCQGCRISLPSNVLSRARSGSSLVQCTNCERILYAA